jgi:hypothetical protein
VSACPLCADFVAEVGDDGVAGWRELLELVAYSIHSPIRNGLTPMPPNSALVMQSTPP